MIPGLGAGAITAKYASKYANSIVNAGISYAKNSRNADDMIEVWRTVGAKEAEGIRRTGRYEYGPTEYKYFFERMEDAVDMAKWKLGLGQPQVVTRGMVPRSVMGRARPHFSAREGHGWVTREGDGVMEQICDAVCVLTIPK